MDTIDRGAVVPLYAQVKRKLRQAILDGKLTDRIPSERQLAKRYDIAQMTARKAIMDLVSEGVLYRQVGKGTFVCRPGTAAQRMYAIGFALYPGVADGAANPYFSMVLRGVEEVARQRGYSVVFTGDIASLTGPGGIDRRDGPGRKVDGVLAVAMDDEQAVRSAARVVPTVLLDNEMDGLSCVLADNISGGLLATRHLIERGHTRIAFLGGHGNSAVGRQRQTGYMQAMAGAGLEVETTLVRECGFRFASGHAQIDRLVLRPDPPTAVFCVNDAVALGAMSRLRELHLDVPGDVSLVGLDDIEPASMVSPALTTVRVPRQRIGRTAAEALLDMIQRGGKGLEPRTVRAGVQLIERESVRNLLGSGIRKGKGTQHEEGTRK